MANENNNGGWANEQVIADLLRRSGSDNQKLIEGLQRAGVSQDTIARALNANSTTINANTRATRDLNQGLGGLFGSTGSRFKQLEGELAGLGGEASGAGGKFARFADFVAKGFSLAKAGFDRAMDLSDRVYEAYGTGVVFKGGMAEFNTAFARLGVDIDTFSKIVNKSSLAVATLGTKRFVELGKVLKDTTNRGAELGLYEAEVFDYLGSYTEQLRFTGELQGMTNDQLIAGTKSYIQELNAVSQATGKRREQIDAELRQQKVSGGYYAVMAKLPEEIRSAMLSSEVRAQFEKFGSAKNEMMDLVAQYMSRNSIAGIQDPATRLMFTQSDEARVAFENYIEALKRKDTAAADVQLKLFKDAIIDLESRLPAGTEFRSGTAATQQLIGRLAQEITTNQETSPGGKIQPIPQDAMEFRATQAAINDAVANVNSQLNLTAVALTRELLPAIKGASEGIVTASETLRKAMESLGLVDANGAMTKEAMMMAVTAGALAVIGSAALYRKVADTLGEKLTGTAAREPSAPGKVNRLLSRLYGVMGAIGEGTDAYNRTGDVTTGLEVGGGSLLGAEVGGAAGMRLGARTRSGLLTLLGGLVGSGMGGMLGADAVEALLGVPGENAGGAPPAEMSAEQQAEAEKLRQDILRANQNNERQTTILEDLKGKLQELIDAVNNQTGDLGRSFERGSGTIR